MTSNLNKLLLKLDFILKYGADHNNLSDVKNELSIMDDDSKLFIISELPQSFILMNENSEEFLLKVLDICPGLFRYFPYKKSERICIRAIQKDKNNFNYISNPSLMIKLFYENL